MSNIIPVKAIYTGESVTALGEMTATDTIAATTISVTPSGIITETTLQGALDELAAAPSGASISDCIVYAIALGG